MKAKRPFFVFDCSKNLYNNSKQGGLKMVLSDESISEQEIKKSRFITYLSRVQTVQEARDFFLKI